MIDLERSLTELAATRGSWLVDDVMRRMAAPRLRRRGLTFRLAGVVVLILVVITIALPGPRHVLGFDSVRTEPSTTTSTTASSPATPVSTAVATSTPNRLWVSAGGQHRSRTAMGRTGLPILADTARRTAVGPRRSATSERADRRGLRSVGSGSGIQRHRSRRPGLGDATKSTTASSERRSAPPSTVRSVDVDGAPGYWIEGAPHDLLFEFGDEILPDTFRLATDTLLWQVGDDVYRLEADVDLDTACASPRRLGEASIGKFACCGTPSGVVQCAAHTLRPVAVLLLATFCSRVWAATSAPAATATTVAGASSATTAAASGELDCDQINGVGANVDCAALNKSLADLTVNWQVVSSVWCTFRTSGWSSVPLAISTSSETTSTAVGGPGKQLASRCFAGTCQMPMSSSGAASADAAQADLTAIGTDAGVSTSTSRSPIAHLAASQAADPTHLRPVR